MDSALETAIGEGADTLYKLEKRLLERFPREKIYVRAFFLDTGRKRTKKEGGLTQHGVNAFIPKSTAPQATTLT